jgi:hypothetical protein
MTFLLKPSKPIQVIQPPRPPVVSHIASKHLLVNCHHPILPFAKKGLESFFLKKKKKKRGNYVSVNKNKSH